VRKHLLTVAIGVLALSGTALAHEPGEVIFRVGAAHVAPDVDSSRVKVGGAQTNIKADVKSDTQLGLTASWIVVPHFGIELLAATPFDHQVKLKPGGGSSVRLGKVKQLPPTLSAQYYFLSPQSRLQPYVGLGVNHTWFFKEKLASAQKANYDDFELENSWGWAAQIGADIQIGNGMYVNASVWKIDIDTKAKLRQANGTPVSVKAELDPWVYFLGLGFRF
jgi:outer membrane protein